MTDDKHVTLLNKLCRVCGGKIVIKSRGYPTPKLVSGVCEIFKQKYGVDVSTDYQMSIPLNYVINVL